MIFLDPTSDIAFKKLFSNQEKKEIAISFLNSVLNLSDKNKITNLVINDPHNHPETLATKLSIVDVRSTDQNGKNYIVEMQVINQKDYAERCQYYSSIAIARQLKRGDEYTALTPVIFVGVICFDLFASKEFLTHHFILNNKTYEHGLKLMEFHFIELTKFNKQIDELTSVVDKWIYLLKNAETMDQVPQQLKNPLEIEEALDILKQGNWSIKELEAYDREADALRVAKSQKATALEEGMKEGVEKGKKQGLEEGKKQGLEEGKKQGLEEGKKQGLEEGKKQGLEEGKKQALINVAKILLQRFSITDVVKMTGLTQQEIENLKNN